MSHLMPLFGRKKKLDNLLKNIEQPGLTVVEALPGQGKTRLLEELCDIVGNGEDRRNKNGQKYLVGYREAAAADSDLLRKALHDLYVLWLSNASYLEQAKQIWASNKDDLIQSFGQLAANIGGVIAALSESPINNMIGNVINGWFNLLVRENRKLKTGGIQGTSAPISYEQARDLLGLLHRISKEPKMVLVLDAFERCPNIAEQADNLDRFLKHIDDWPPCHFLIAVRRPPADNEDKELEGYEQAKKLRTAHGPLVQTVRLRPMVLSESGEQERVFNHIRKTLPKPRAWFDGLDRDWLFECLEGYPLTLRHWLKGNPTCKEELEDIANNAKLHKNNYLRQKLIKLRKDHRGLFKVALRIALLPEQREDSWESFRPIVLAGIDNGDDALADLTVHGVLDSADPPSFGHTTVYDAARRFILLPADDAGDSFNAHASNEIKHLIISCAKRIRSIEPEAAPYAEVLAFLRSAGEDLRIDDAHLGLCAAAVLISSQSASANMAPKWLDRLSSAAKKAAKGGIDFPAALLAMALMNAIFHCGKDHERCDGLIQELRELYEKHGETDPAVREELARGLFNAFINAEGERAEGFLQELRGLYGKHGETDPAVREALARGLANAIFHYDRDHERCGGLIQELRDLYEKHGETDPAVREMLAKGLNNAIGHCGKDHERCDGLIQELRELCEKHGETDSVVRKWLASGLFNAFHEAEGERAEGFLQELRDLYEKHGETDPAVREWLANGLFNAFHEAEGERAKEFLRELRDLYEKHGETDPVVRERLARALAVQLENYLNEGDQAKARAAYDELKEFYEKHGDDDGVRNVWEYVNKNISELPTEDEDGGEDEE